MPKDQEVTVTVVIKGDDGEIFSFSAPATLGDLIEDGAATPGIMRVAVFLNSVVSGL